MAIPRPNSAVITQLQEFMKLQQEIDPTAYMDANGNSILSSADGKWGAKTYESLVKFVSSDPELARRIPIESLGDARHPPSAEVLEQVWNASRLNLMFNEPAKELLETRAPNNLTSVQKSMLSDMLGASSPQTYLDQRKAVEAQPDGGLTDYQKLLTQNRLSFLARGAETGQVVGYTDLVRDIGNIDSFEDFERVAQAVRDNRPFLESEMTKVVDNPSTYVRNATANDDYISDLQASMSVWDQFSTTVDGDLAPDWTARRGDSAVKINDDILANSHTLQQMRHALGLSDPTMSLKLVDTIESTIEANPDASTGDLLAASENSSLPLKGGFVFLPGTFAAASRWFNADGTPRTFGVGEPEILGPVRLDGSAAPRAPFADDFRFTGTDINARLFDSADSFGDTGFSFRRVDGVADVADAVPGNTGDTAPRPLAGATDEAAQAVAEVTPNTHGFDFDTARGPITDGPPLDATVTGDSRVMVDGLPPATAERAAGETIEDSLKRIDDAVAELNRLAAADNVTLTGTIDDAFEAAGIASPAALDTAAVEINRIVAANDVPLVGTIDDALDAARITPTAAPIIEAIPAAALDDAAAEINRIVAANDVPLAGTIDDAFNAIPTTTLAADVDRSVYAAVEAAVLPAEEIRLVTPTSLDEVRLVAPEVISPLGANTIIGTAPPVVLESAAVVNAANTIPAVELDT
jgi:hypothetical protein